jgi:hypothetical protein
MLPYLVAGIPDPCRGQDRAHIKKMFQKVPNQVYSLGSCQVGGIITY